MLYLKYFNLPTDEEELDYLFDSKKSGKLDMQCYNNQYPFGIFPHKRLSKIEFEPITIFYGGNGSGKSTLLNVISEKLGIDRSSQFNNTPLMRSYLGMCSYSLASGAKAVPSRSRTRHRSTD